VATTAKPLATLNEELAKSVALLEAVRALRLPAQVPGRFRALPNFQLALVAELAFLRCFLSWEIFLEECFLAYASGSETPSGTTYTCFLAAPNRESTKAILVGERRAFATWTNPKDVTQRAQLYFEKGEPFASALATAGGALADMVVVRNRIAHRSGTAAQNFLSLIRRRYGSVQPGMSPGRFLLGPAPNPVRRQIDDYVIVLKAASRQIAS
jgi:hypothetical protein